MEGPKQRSGGSLRRRRRAARMQRQCDASEGEEDSPPARQKRPPARKKRNKEPVFQEDIVDGFAFLCFKTYEDLERTVTKFEKKPEEGDAVSGGEEVSAAPHNSNGTDHPPVLEESPPQLDKKPKNKKNNNILPKVKKKNLINKVHNNVKDSSMTNNENSRPGEEILETPRGTSRDQLSDASSHASLERGYMCDSESGDERGSEPECDLFSSKHNDSNFIAKKNNPGHSQTCRSPPVLPPIHPVQNGTHHPEPSTAVAAVTAGASPANTSSAMVVGAASPREPQIGSPAVVPVSCSSPASPPSGVVPASPQPPPFLPLTGKDSASGSGNKLISNGYEFVSDTSPPSPLAATTKLLSPSKYLHKRVHTVPSCRDSSVPATNKPAINVYDFVSDHSAPSSPDGVIFLSQSKFLHKGPAPTSTVTSKDPEKVGVSNGHGGTANLCTSSPPPVLSAASAVQNSHKSALDMSMKTNVKSEHPPSILPPVVNSSEHRLQISPGQSRSTSYSSIPYSTSQQQQPNIRKMSASPRMSPLTVPTSLPSPALSLPPSSAVAASPTLVTSLRTSVSTAAVPIATASHVLAGRCRSPVVTTASHPNTPTPVPTRDTHSSHSNSSLSSLSQLSTSVHKEREGTGSRSHSNSSNVAPLVSAALTSSSAYASASSLAGLVFSKPHCWSGTSSTNTISAAATRSSPLPPRSSPALSSSGSSLPLPQTLPPAHHTSPFSNHPGPPPPPLLPVANHHTMFTPGSLTPTLPLEATAGPSPYRSETLFPQPNPDLLRRELDTRFLASQDHSIPIPPPPYMQSDVQHHNQMHQQAPPPFMAPPMHAQQTSHPHLNLQSPGNLGFVAIDNSEEREIQALLYYGKNYEKYPKLDSALYGRPSIGLSGYPPVSALFAPGGGASTPFAPPAHLAALQPKINSVSKTKSMKPGKWCAMHVRIAWEIYNHQQKHKRAEAHKAGIALAASAMKPPEHLHAANHLFCSLPRQHELSPFSSSLLTAAASHPRSFEASSHHSTFLNPTPAHLGPFARPGYPSFAGPAPGFSGLGPLGLPGPAMLSADLRGGCLPGDPWTQRSALSFTGGPPWGGLKEEAERDRLQQERKREEERQKRAEQERREKELERERREQERREQERREMERREQERKEQERKEKERREQERREMERREMERREQERREQDRREQERQKERDRDLRLHHQMQKSSAIVLNGEIRDHHFHHQTHPHHHHHQQQQHAQREWERVARDGLARSPQVVQQQPTPNNPVKYEGVPLDRHVYAQPIVKIKQERKDDESPRQTARPVDDRMRGMKRPGSIGQSDPNDPMSLLSRSHNAVSLGLEHQRVMGAHGLVPSPSKVDPLAQTSPLWGPLTPSPTVTGIPDHYRTARGDLLPGRPGEHHDRRFDTGNELSRQLDLERQLLDRAAYDRATKQLLPPPLRANESPYGTPPSLPPASASSSFFSPPVSPYLNSLSSSGRSKPMTMNGLPPPPLIPCTFPPGFTTARTSSPMAGAHKLLPPGAGVLNLHEAYFPKDRREVNGHPPDMDAHLRL